MTPRNMRRLLLLGAATLSLTFQNASSPAWAGALDRVNQTVPPIVIMIGGDDFAENGGTAPIATDFLLLTTVPGTAGADLIADDGVTVDLTGGLLTPTNGGAGGYVLDILDPVSGGDFISQPADQVLDAADSYTAFELSASTDLTATTNTRTSYFLVVSNAPFDIYAEASDLVATGDFSGFSYANIGYQIRVQVSGGTGASAWGAQAQDPAIGGTGAMPGINDLGDIDGAPVKVFDGGRRTAAQRGPLLGQAVAFQSGYRLQRSGFLGGLFDAIFGPPDPAGNYDLSMGTGELSATVTYTAYTP